MGRCRCGARCPTSAIGHQTRARLSPHWRRTSEPTSSTARTYTRYEHLISTPPYINTPLISTHPPYINTSPHWQRTSESTSNTWCELTFVCCEFVGLVCVARPPPQPEHAIPPRGAHGGSPLGVHRGAGARQPGGRAQVRQELLAHSLQPTCMSTFTQSERLRFVATRARVCGGRYVAEKPESRAVLGNAIEAFANAAEKDTIAPFFRTIVRKLIKVTNDDPKVRHVSPPYTGELALFFFRMFNRN
eukprot:775845-Prorocentrum_minimum.AAC.1